MFNDNEYFFIYTKKNEEWFIGTPDGKQKNIITSKNFNCDSEIVSNLSSKKNNNKFSFENYYHPIFYEISEECCKDDPFWNNIFLKMAKNIFHSNVKFLVTDKIKNKNEYLIGELSLKKNLTKKTPSLIITKDKSLSETFDDIKTFYKKHLSIVSNKDNLILQEESKKKENTKFQITPYDLKKFINLLDKEEYINKKELKTIIFLYFKSINNNNIFVTDDKKIKKIKNIFWNKETSDFNVFFLQSLKTNEKLIEIYNNEKDIYNNIIKKNISIPLEYFFENESLIKEIKILKNIFTNNKFIFFLNFYEDFILQHEKEYFDSNLFNSQLKNKFDSTFNFSNKEIFKIKLIYPSLFFVIGQLKGELLYDKLKNNLNKIIKYNKINFFQLKNCYEKNNKNFFEEKYILKKVNKNFFDNFNKNKENDFKKLFVFLFKNFLNKLLYSHYLFKKRS